jgi:hypothetical protein
LVTPLAEASTIDGVFYDCFNFAYELPQPWNRQAVNIPNCTVHGGAGCEALLTGTAIALVIVLVIVLVIIFGDHFALRVPHLQFIQRGVAECRPSLVIS